MDTRAKLLFIILFLLTLLFTACQTGSKKTPFFLRPLHALIEHHRKKTSPMDGQRCPLYPSCSDYAQQAIEKYAYSGFLAFLDRLFYRESGRLYLKYFCAPKTTGSLGALLYYDPLEESFLFFEGESPEKRRYPSLLKENFDCY